MSVPRLTRRRAIGLAVVVAMAAIGLSPIVANSANAGSPAGTDPAAAVADDGAKVTAETWLDARMVDLSISSTALGKTAPVRVILPTAFAAQPDRTWPVLMLMQGAHDNYTAWTRQTDIEQFTADKDVLTVMPDGGPTGIGSDLWNFGLGGPPDYEQFHLTELTQILERGYRASSTRAIAGVSTGGMAAMAYPARHPGTFTAAASYSGVLDTTLSTMPAVVEAIMLRENLNPLSLWGDPALQRDIWRAHNPNALASELRGTALYVSSGSGLAGTSLNPDLLLGEALESALFPAAQTFTETLNRLDITATTHLYDGGVHDWPPWRVEFKRSWPMLAAGLGLPAAQAQAG